MKEQIKDLYITKWRVSEDIYSHDAVWKGENKNGIGHIKEKITNRKIMDKRVNEAIRKLYARSMDHFSTLDAVEINTYINRTLSKFETGQCHMRTYLEDAETEAMLWKISEIYHTSVSNIMRFIYFGVMPKEAFEGYEDLYEAIKIRHKRLLIQIQLTLNDIKDISKSKLSDEHEPTIDIENIIPENAEPSTYNIEEYNTEHIAAVNS